jgi:LuxR family maltose regulon positive regulatory protein
MHKLICNSFLHFSVEETQIFLEQALSFPLPSELARRLTERTEGWAVGVHLAALALHAHNDPQDSGQVLKTFTGSHCHVLEYLVTEVLNAQPEPVQEFLLQTSILNRLTASLCDATTGSVNGDELLNHLERAHLFLVSLDDSRSEWSSWILEVHMISFHLLAWHHCCWELLQRS